MRGDWKFVAATGAGSSAPNASPLGEYGRTTQYLVGAVPPDVALPLVARVSVAINGQDGVRCKGPQGVVALHNSTLRGAAPPSAAYSTTPALELVGTGLFGAVPLRAKFVFSVSLGADGLPRAHAPAEDENAGAGGSMLTVTHLADAVWVDGGRVEVVGVRVDEARPEDANVGA